MTSNPYSSPMPSDSKQITSNDPTQGCGSEIAWLLLPPIVFTFVGFAWYVLSATIVENIVMPYVEPYKYSYGDPAIFLCLPLSTFYGLLTGIAVSFFGSKQRKYGGVGLLLVAATTALCTLYWWNHFENAAECNSKYVLFYPLYAFSILVGPAGMIVNLKLNRKRNGG